MTASLRELLLKTIRIQFACSIYLSGYGAVGSNAHEVPGITRQRPDETPALATQACMNLRTWGHELCLVCTPPFGASSRSDTCYQIIRVSISGLKFGPLEGSLRKTKIPRTRPSSRLESNVHLADVVSNFVWSGRDKASSSRPRTTWGSTRASGPVRA